MSAEASALDVLQRLSTDQSRTRTEKLTQVARLLDLFAEDNRLNVYAGKLEVRPPGAPTTRAGFRGIKGSDRS
jgi:hypothetical protein